MKKLYIIIAILILFISCRQAEQHGDAAPSSAAAAPMYNFTTPLGFKIQSNGYDFDPDYIDNAFLETESCLGYSDTPTDIYIVLKTEEAFPCVSLPKTGCGGTYLFPIIKVASDFEQHDPNYLKHECIHYILDYHTSDPDTSHQTSSFDQCS